MNVDTEAVLAGQPVIEPAKPIDDFEITREMCCPKSQDFGTLFFLPKLESVCTKIRSISL